MTKKIKECNNLVVYDKNGMEINDIEIVPNNIQVYIETVK